jgi:hypothetical protein
MTSSPPFNYLGRFLITGILVTYGLLFLATPMRPFLGFGVGDGAGHYDAPSSWGVALPYTSYFVCGIIAATSARRSIRIGAAIIAHSAPFVSLAFADPESRTFFVGLAAVIYVVFGSAWFRMLRSRDETA